MNLLLFLMDGQGDVLKQIPLQIKFSWFPSSKHQQVLLRALTEMSFVLAHLFPQPDSGLSW